MARKRKASKHNSVPSFVRNDFLRCELWRRNPYSAAHYAFVAGLIPMAQAVGMVASDGDFIGEFTLGAASGRYDDDSVLDAARRVVSQWRGELVEAIQQSKRSV